MVDARLSQHAPGILLAMAEADSCLESFELYESESVSSSSPGHNAPLRRAGVAVCLLLLGKIVLSMMPLLLPLCDPVKAV